MSIISTTDKSGHALRSLVWQAINLYPTPAIHLLLSNKDNLVRCIAAAQLQIRSEISTLAFIENNLMNSKKYKNREIAAFILGQLRIEGYEDRIRDLLIKLLSDKHESVVETAIYACGHQKLNVDYKKYLRVDPSKSIKNAINFKY